MVLARVFSVRQALNRARSAQIAAPPASLYHASARLLNPTRIVSPRESDDAIAAVDSAAIPNDNVSDVGALDIESKHPNIEEVNVGQVKQGLTLANSDNCPFLSQVKTRVNSDPALMAALHRPDVDSHALMKQAIDDTLCSVLDDLRNQKRYREFKYFARRVGVHPAVTHEIADRETGATRVQEAVTWCSNDYLNMGHHHVVLDAMHEMLNTQGAGAGGTRNISGSNVIHSRLERELADLCNTEASLLYSSCYNANLGVMEGLSEAFRGKPVMVFSDSENHASLVHGIRNSRLPKQIFRHNDLDHLESLLKATPQETTKIVIFESVYSMSGTKCNVNRMLDLCEEYDVISIIDEVHAIGLYGPQGGGILDELNQRGRATIITGTLGKAFGVSGGFAAASAAMIDVIRSTSPSFIFTTSMAPVIAAGALASVRHVRSHNEDRALLMEKCTRMKASMKALGLPLMSEATHIMPLLVGEGSLCKKISDELLERGIYIQPINYPSVPKGEELLRITVGPKHTEEQINHLLANLVDLFRQYNLLNEDAMQATVEMHS